MVPASRVVTPIEFHPETNTAFEVGSKNMFLDHTLRLNMAAFYYVYKNMQYIEVDPVPFRTASRTSPRCMSGARKWKRPMSARTTSCISTAICRLRTARCRASISPSIPPVANAIENQPFPSPCAFGGAYYNPACWAAHCLGSRNIGGHQPAKMPKVSGSLAVSYNFRVPTGVLTPRVQYIYRGSFWARMFEEPTLDKVPSYSLVNLNLQYVPDNSNFTVALALTNVADEAGVNSRYTDPYGIGQTSQQFIPPRQFIATVGYTF